MVLVRRAGSRRWLIGGRGGGGTGGGGVGRVVATDSRGATLAGGRFGVEVRVVRFLGEAIVHAIATGVEGAVRPLAFSF